MMSRHLLTGPDGGSIPSASCIGSFCQELCRYSAIARHCVMQKTNLRGFGPCILECSVMASCFVMQKEDFRRWQTYWLVLAVEASAVRDALAASASSSLVVAMIPLPALPCREACKDRMSANSRLYSLCVVVNIYI